MKNLVLYIFTIFIGIFCLIISINVNFFQGSIDYFGYIAIFMIIAGSWGIVNGELHKEYDWITTFVLIVFVTAGVVLALSLLGV